MIAPKAGSDDVCQSCKGEPKDWHPCPFSVDVDGDDETLCNCCDECEDNCADDI